MEASTDAQQAMQPDQSNEQQGMEDSDEMRKSKRQGGDTQLPISVNVLQRQKQRRENTNLVMVVKPSL